MTTPAISNKKFGPIRLMPGVLRRNMAAYYWGAFISIMVFTFWPQALPFLFNEILAVPPEQQGTAAGTLSLVGEIVLLLTLSFYGSLSDRIGRRPIYVFGFFLVALGTWLSPYAADLTQLSLYRIVFAFGSSAITAMLATVVADYALDADRGKATGLQGVANGLGAVVTVFVLLRLPAFFQSLGLSGEQAGQAAFASAAGLAALAAVVLWLFLKPGRAVATEESRGFLNLMQEGVRAAKDPGIALAYAAAFVSRGDLAVVGTYFTLWIANYAQYERGLEPAAALARAGLVVGVAQMFALLGAPLIGLLTDRIKRVDAMILAVAISAIGYTSTLLISDPLGQGMFAVAALIGLGEVGGVISSGVLIAQQSSRVVRGSIIGVFSFCGSVGILVAGLVGGLLFDVWRPAGPFVLFGVFGAVVVVWGLLVRSRVVPALDKE